MTQRYSLRFDSGERHGESIPIVGESFTIGRRPGNSLQIVENSVSGRHAQLQIAGENVTLRDLGSTNGTHVANVKIEETPLSHGTAILFGSVRMIFEDTSIAGNSAMPDAPVPSAASVAPGAGGEANRVSDELLRKSKGSKGGLLILLIVIAVAAGGGWYFLKGGGATGGGLALRPVTAVAGNLLAATYSFEGEDGDWSSYEGTSAAFISDTGARYSGATGVSATVDAGQYAVYASQPVNANQDGQLVAAAQMRADGAQARLGIEFSMSGEGGPSPLQVWSKPIADGAEFTAAEIRCSVPRGYDRARVLLYGSASADGGAVDADDVSLVASSGGSAQGSSGEYRLYALGSPATVGSLFKIDRVFLSGVRFSADIDGALADGGIAARTSFAVTEESIGLRITPQSASRFTLRVEPETYAAGLATMGSGGSHAHSADFDREDVDAVLVAFGMDLVRIGFDSPAKVRGRAVGGGLDLTVELGAGGVMLQTVFDTERIAAAQIAGKAHNAEQDGRLGDCLLAWRELVDTYPYELELLQRADAVSSRLLRDGLLEVDALQAKVERARFFRLADLYAECAAQAKALGARYAGSEVETRMQELTVGLVAERSALMQDLDRFEKGRLESILAVLEAQESKKLASQVKAYLDEHFGVER